jgi:hypothetical protein
LSSPHTGYYYKGVQIILLILSTILAGFAIWLKAKTGISAWELLLWSSQLSLVATGGPPYHTFIVQCLRGNVACYVCVFLGVLVLLILSVAGVVVWL